MNQTTRTILIGTGAVLAGAVLLFGGIFIGRASWGLSGFWPVSMMDGNLLSGPPGLTGSQFNAQVGQGMMRAFGQANPDNSYLGYGMMGSGMTSSGMMGADGQTDPGNPYFGYGMMGSGMMSSGMMGADGQIDPDNPYFGYGMMGSGMMSSGMMGGFRSSGLLDIAPLTIADAQQAVQDYLDGLGDADLAVGEIMIFDNHAYAQIVELSSGIGAMEVIVDPVTREVYPEHGPNMMWNLKYSPMSGHGMMGIMMGGMSQTGRSGMMGSRPDLEPTAEMPVSAQQAVAAAQDYLDVYLPGTQADEHVDPFYGYYTLHILREGDVVGMLSVNGFTSQVFLHTWHGEFLEMTESHHD